MLVVIVRSCAVGAWIWGGVAAGLICVLVVVRATLRSSVMVW